MATAVARLHDAVEVLGATQTPARHRGSRAASLAAAILGSATAGDTSPRREMYWMPARARKAFNASRSTSGSSHNSSSLDAHVCAVQPRGELAAKDECEAAVGEHDPP